MGLFSWFEGIIHPGGIFGDTSGNQNGTITNWLKTISRDIRATSARLRDDQLFIERWGAAAIAGTTDSQMLNSSPVPLGYTPQNIEYTVPAPTKKVTNNTTVSLISQNSILSPGSQGVVGGNYQLVITRGTNPGTVKMAYNNGMPVDNISANANNVVLSGGDAGQIVVSIGAIPSSFPVSETINVTAKIFFLKGMRVALDAPGNSVNINISLQVGEDKKIRVAMNTNSPTDASSYDPAVPVLAGNTVRVWAHSSSGGSSTVTFVRFTGIEEFV